MTWTILSWLVAVAQGAQAAPFSDNFDREDAGGWRSVEGRWSVREGALEAPAGGRILSPGPDWADGVFEADVRIFAEEQRAGLLVRASRTGPLSGYFAAIRKSADRARVELIRFVRGAAVCLQDPMVAGIEPGKPCRIRVVLKGPGIWVYARHMDRPAIAEHDEGLAAGAAGFMAERRASFDDAAVMPLPDRLPAPPSLIDFGWVKGAIYFPSRVVNSVQFWEEYDPAMVDRELHYAQVYGLTAVSIYLNYHVWRDGDRLAFLGNLDDFLRRAEARGLRVSPILFDQCGNEDTHLGPQNPPIPGVHNARMMRSPHREIVQKPARYEAEREGLRRYALDVVGPRARDPRIFLWQGVNEPLEEAIERLAADAYGWIKSAGTPIPAASTAGGFLGGRWSDVYTLHVYLPKKAPPYDQPVYGHLAGREHLVTETINRPYLSVPRLVDAYGPAGVGWMMWDLMIGNLNTRWEWGSQRGAPEPAEPFHGLVYPDGHPWSVEDIRKIIGKDDLSGLPVFNVEYFRDADFRERVHSSITPRIDFDLSADWGTGSVDPQRGMPADGFSIRWTGKVIPPRTGTYVFYVDSDEAARLRVGGRLVVDKKSLRREEICGSVDLQSGASCDLAVEYVDTVGDTSIHVSWSGPGFEKTLLPGRR